MWCEQRHNDSTSGQGSFKEVVRVELRENKIGKRSRATIKGYLYKTINVLLDVYIDPWMKIYKRVKVSMLTMFTIR